MTVLRIVEELSFQDGIDAFEHLRQFVCVCSIFCIIKKSVYPPLYALAGHSSGMIAQRRNRSAIGTVQSSYRASRALSDEY